MSAEAIAIAGVGVALLAVLVPLLLTLHRRAVGEIAEVRRDLHYASANRRARARKLVSQSRAIGHPPREKAEYFTILSVGVGTIGVMLALLGMMAVLLVMLFDIDERVERRINDLDGRLGVFERRQDTGSQASDHSPDE